MFPFATVVIQVLFSMERELVIVGVVSPALVIISATIMSMILRMSLLEALTACLSAISAIFIVISIIRLRLFLLGR